MPRANTPRQQRAERRAAQVSTPRTPRAASKQSHAVLRGPRGSAVATSSNIRVTTGQTPRVGNDDEDIVMVNLREGQDEEQQPPPVRQVLHIQMQQPPPIPQDPAAQAVPRVRPGIVANAGGDDGGGSSGSSDDGRGDGGQPGGQAPPGPAGDGVGGGYQAQGGQRAAALPVPPPPPSPATAPLYATPATPAWVYQAPGQEKKLRLPKFKGLDEPKLTVKAWLKAVKNELRRQVTILRTEWREHEVFIEMVASLEGEALLWYDSVEDAFEHRENQTFGRLSQMLRDRYMVKRSNPEVVARLRQRTQQRGESLVEYAQKLREIASSNPVDDEWLVDSFLGGMSNKWHATLVRGHRPATLNEAVNAAVDQVGEYGEGYGVGLLAAIQAHDARTVTGGVAAPQATHGAAPLVPTGVFAGQVAGGSNSGNGANLGAVVTGYGDFGLATGLKPRYDVEGRIEVRGGGTVLPGGGQWNAVVPVGYRLVPAEVEPRGYEVNTCNNASAQGHPSTQAQGPRTDQHSKPSRTTGKARKMESQNVSQQSQQTWYGGRKSSSREPLRTKEERMQNHQRYLDQRGQQRPVIRTSTSRPEDMCYYCHGLGHHAYECKLKKADMEDAGPVVNQADDEEQKDNSGSGNGQRV